MDGWMDGGWQGKRMMVGGERELMRVSMTRLGCLVAHPKSGDVFKVRPKTRHLLQSPNFSESTQYTVYTQGLTQVLVTVFGPREAKSRSQTIHNRANINVEVNIVPFSTGERRKRGRNDKYV